MNTFGQGSRLILFKMLCKRVVSTYESHLYTLHSVVNNSSKTTFWENITLFKQRLRHRGYPNNLIDKTLSEVNFKDRMSALQNKKNKKKRAKTFWCLLQNVALLWIVQYLFQTSIFIGPLVQ